MTTIDPTKISTGRYRLARAIDSSAGLLMPAGLEMDVIRSDGESGRWELYATNKSGAQIELVQGYKGTWAFAGGPLAEAIIAAMESIPAVAAAPATDPTPRERGQNTCRAALMTVIGLHRRGDGLLDAAPFIVAAVQALMDLDGLRAGEAAALDVAKERDEARALAEGLTRGQDDLRRQLRAMEAERDATAAERDRVVEANAALRKLHHGALAGLEEMTGRRDLAMQDRDAARERMSKAEAEAVILQERLAAFRRGMDAETEIVDAWNAWAQEQPGVVSGMTWEAAREVIGKALAERESWPRLQHALEMAATSEERRQHLAALRMLGWQGQPVEEWAQEQVSAARHGRARRSTRAGSSSPSATVL